MSRERGQGTKMCSAVTARGLGLSVLLSLPWLRSNTGRREWLPRGEAGALKQNAGRVESNSQVLIDFSSSLLILD